MATFQYKSTWESGITYVLNDVATKTEFAYIHKTASHLSTSSDEPEVGSNWGSYWNNFLPIYSAETPLTPSLEGPDYPLSITSVTSTIKSEMEGGYVVTRSKYTRSRKKWNLKWSMLPYSHYNFLERFFSIVVLGAANSFIWPHTMTGVLYTVRFEEDELNFNLSTPGVTGFYEGSVTLVEV